MKPDSLDVRYERIALYLLEHATVWFLWVVVAAAAITFIKIYYGKRINLWLDGKFWHSHRNFDFDDEVIVDDILSRMVRTTTTDTVFYQYIVDDEDRVVGADRLVVSNDKLKDLKITKQIPNHHRSRKLRPVHE